MFNLNVKRKDIKSVCPCTKLKDHNNTTVNPMNRTNVNISSTDLFMPNFDSQAPDI